MSRPAAVIDWAIAARALPGERESGDLHVVEVLPEGVLVAVIDGLGHGPEAAAAARVARATLNAYPTEPVEALVQRCHQELRPTRGVVMTLVSIDPQGDALTWLGIGNVDGYVLRGDGTTGRRREAIVHRGGVVGFSLPSARPVRVPLTPGDLLILATDGIANGFAETRYRGTPQQVADDILARYGKLTDDALVLVARYDGAAR
jgi:phosphoserine phosphatase RsbX